jgi:hypothetical protein
MHRLLALIQAGQGDLEAGLKSASQALQTARTASLTESEIESMRVLGTLRGRADDYAAAETLLRESADLCQKHNDPYRQALALLELGRVYQHMAHSTNPAQIEWEAKGVRALEQAIEKFGSLGATHDLGVTQTLLSEIQLDAIPDVPEGEE